MDKAIVNEQGNITPGVPQIYGLIGQAMREIGAIGKDSVNQQQKFRYRGIDAVYNALNPVMAKLGLFITPEILDHRREERRTAKKDSNGNPYESVLMYSILTIRYTMFAPDGSSVSCTVIGEGMDSGDKASNKAMSIAMKYACFQLFMIPTEAVDPDAECHEIAPKNAPAGVVTGLQIMENERRTQAAPKQEAPQTFTRPAPAAATVSKAQLPQEAPKTSNPVLDYLAKEREELRSARGITAAENGDLWTKQVTALKEKGIVENKPLSTFTMKEAQALVQYMYSLFKSSLSAELKDA